MSRSVHRRGLTMAGLALLLVMPAWPSGLRAQSLTVPDRQQCGQHTTFHQAVPSLASSANGDAAAAEIVRSIVTQLGLTANFRLRTAPFGNVAATLCEDQSPPGRYLIYDPRLLNNVGPGSPNHWTLMFALAHEIGHHVSDHGTDDKDRARLENEADFFAAFALARLGAGQEDVAAAVNRLAGLQREAGGLSLDVRLAETARGWQEGLNARTAAQQARPAMTIKADTYVEGEGYHAITSATVPVCREACVQDKRCAMYEFHRPSRTCGLFDHAKPAGPSADAEVGIKAGAALERKSAVAVWRIALKPDAYVAGEGYQVRRGSTASDCQQACLADVRCVMFEFYRPNASCGLFDHNRIAGPSSRAEVGMKTPAVEAEPSAVKPLSVRLAVRPNIYVEGSGYRTLRNSTTDACRTACLGDDRCRMYEIHRPTQSCGLFDHTRTAGPSTDAETGIKVAR